MNHDITIRGAKMTVSAIADDAYPSCDRLVIFSGALSLGIWKREERKAFIEAILAADAELDAAAEKREVAA